MDLLPSRKRIGETVTEEGLKDLNDRILGIKKECLILEGLIKEKLEKFNTKEVKKEKLEDFLGAYGIPTSFELIRENKEYDTETTGGDSWGLGGVQREYTFYTVYFSVGGEKYKYRFGHSYEDNEFHQENRGNWKESKMDGSTVNICRMMNSGDLGRYKHLLEESKNIKR